MWRTMLLKLLRDLVLDLIHLLMDDDANGNEIAKKKGA